MRGLAPLAALLALALAASARGAPHGDARASRSMSVRDEGSLTFVRGLRQRIVDEGRVSGTLSGWGRAYFSYNGSPTVYAQFVIWGPGWSIDGSGTGTMNNPNSPDPSFRGRLTLHGGSGRYSHATGSGALYGVFSRRNYGLVVQTITELHY